MFSSLWSRIVDIGHATPDQPALSDGEGSWTYAELAQRVRGAVEWLRAKGVEPGDVIAVDAEPVRAWWVAALALWQIGAVYLPLDHEQPESYRAELIGDSGARLVLDAEALKAIATTEGRDGAEVRPDSAEPVALIYTSGSTGRPKGVELHGIGLAQVLRETLRLCPLPTGARVRQHLSPAFDASLMEAFLAFGNGGVLVVGRGTHGRLRPSLSTSDAAILTPSLLRVLTPADLVNLKLLVCGGEALLWSDLRDVAPQTDVLNAYGPTECTIYATAYQAGRRRDGTGPVPIGSALVGLQADVDGGELVITGPTVARGYRGGPAFGGRYRTGDRVEWRDGELVYLGRLGNQVKVRGFRLELAEVEHRLRALRGVRDVAACTAPDGHGGQALCAAVVGADVAEAARTALPLHLVPTRWLLVDELPRMVSGKTDRRRVAAWFERPDPTSASRPTEATKAVGDDDPVSVMCALVTAVLGQPVRPEDDFFGIGGDSLTALRLQSAIGERYGVAVDLDAINDAPTIADLAAAVRDAS